MVGMVGGSARGIHHGGTEDTEKNTEKDRNSNKRNSGADGNEH
jgi:hypothetical protein